MLSLGGQCRRLQYSVCRYRCPKDRLHQVGSDFKLELQNFRTGKRTKLGLLMDGKNSAVRYYKNNFCDGYRQVSPYWFKIKIFISFSKIQNLNHFSGFDWFFPRQLWVVGRISLPIPGLDSNESSRCSYHSHCFIFNGHYWRFTAAK